MNDEPDVNEETDVKSDVPAERVSESRRRFVKAAGATGAAAVGIGTFGGSAAAQVQDIQVSDVQLGEGLIVIQVSEVLKEVDVELVIQDINVDIEVTEVVNITDAVIQVAVAVLGDIHQEGVLVATVNGVTEDGEDFTATDRTPIGPQDV